MVVGGAPPREASRQDSDQKCPRMVCRFTRPVHSGRVRRADTPLRLFTRARTGFGLRRAG